MPTNSFYTKDFFCIEEKYKHLKISADIFITQTRQSIFLFNIKPSKKQKKTISFYTDLLKSNCRITNQPDWGRLAVIYEPNNYIIDEESFLKYVIQFRLHQEFHEPMCEKIYQHIWTHLKPKNLIVICQYTRRGGLDINPVRYSNKSFFKNKAIDLPKLLQQ